MTEHIKIPAILPRVQYVANGTNQVFTYPFPIFDANDIQVWLDAALQNNGYVVNNIGQTNGGTISFNIAPDNGVVVTIERRLPLARMTDFVEGGEFSAQSINQEFDTLMACVQQINADSLPMLRYDNTEAVGDVVIPKKAIRANKVLGFDGQGNPVAVATNSTVGMPTFTAVGIGAVSRTLTDKAREIVSVRDFGAVGDGIANDTVAIMAALAAADSVYMPAGTYLINQTIELIDNKYLFGAGASTIIKANTQNFDVIAIIGSYGCLFNMTLDGGDSAVRLYGKTMPCRHNQVQNIVIKNSLVGIELDGFENITNPCEWHNISNVHISNVATHGVWLTKSGAGKAPSANKFKSVRVQSGVTSLTGHGFFLQSAKYHNAFIDCAVYVSATAQTCFKVGADAERNLIINLMTESAGSVVNLVLDAGSKETALHHVQALSAGTILQDNSGGDYTVVNINSAETNRLRRTRITDLTTEIQRYHIESITSTAQLTINPDLTKGVYLLNATGGNIWVNLPKATVSNSGVVITFKKVDTSINVVTIAEISGLGPDGRNAYLANSQDVITIVSDGSVWRILSSNTMLLNHQNFQGATGFYPDAQKRLYTVSANIGHTTVRLPPAANAVNIGRVVTIKKIDSTTNTVTITEEGALGPDNAAYVIIASNHAITVMSDGVRWRILNKFVG